MTIFHWVMAVLSGLLAVCAAVTFLIFILRDGQEWLILARRFGRWTWAACLFWFNVTIWGRVVYTLLHWNG